MYFWSSVDARHWEFSEQNKSLSRLGVYILVGKGQKKKKKKGKHLLDVSVIYGMFLKRKVSQDKGARRTSIF